MAFNIHVIQFQHNIMSLGYFQRSMPPQNSIGMLELLGQSKQISGTLRLSNILENLAGTSSLIYLDRNIYKVHSSEQSKLKYCRFPERHEERRGNSTSTTLTETRWKLACRGL